MQRVILARHEIEIANIVDRMASNAGHGMKKMQRVIYIYIHAFSTIKIEPFSGQAAADGSLERTLQQATAVPTRGSSEVISSKHPATPAPAPKPQPKARPADEQAKQAQAAARKRIAAQFKTLADADKTADPSSISARDVSGGTD